MMNDYSRFEDYEREAQEAALDQTKERLVAVAHETFDIDLSAHRSALCALWQQAFPDEPFPAQRRSTRWAELGFQGHDPVSDLRGAGLLGVIHFTHLLASLGSDYREVVGDFPLALASLSVTAALCRHFGLHRTLVVPGVSEAPPHITRALLVAMQAAEQRVHYGAEPDVLKALHVSIVRHLASAWSHIPPCDAKIMQFNMTLRATLAHAERVIGAATTPWSVTTIATAIETEGGADGLADGVCMQLHIGTWAVLAVLRLIAVRLGCAAEQLLSERESDTRASRMSA